MEGTGKGDADIADDSRGAWPHLAGKVPALHGPRAQAVQAPGSYV